MINCHLARRLRDLIGGFIAFQIRARCAALAHFCRSTSNLGRKAFRNVSPESALGL